MCAATSSDFPAGSYMGNGNQWADSARRLGYWVDSTPRQGDVMVFQSGQAGSSLIYGHVAIVEQVNEDGSIVTSEWRAAYNGQPFSRTFPASEVGDYRTSTTNQGGRHVENHQRNAAGVLLAAFAVWCANELLRV